MNTYKNILLYLLKAMLHIGVVLLIVFAQIKICGIAIKGNGLLIFTPFFLISLLGCIVQPMFCKNKTIKKYLFYILCVTNFITSYILMYFTREGLFPFTIIIFTIFLLYFLVNLSLNGSYFKEMEYIRLLIDRNIKFICYFGALPIFSFLLYFHLQPHNAEIASTFKIIELSIVFFWLIYNVVYLHNKHLVLVIFLIITLLSIIPQYLDYSFVNIALILVPVCCFAIAFFNTETKSKFNFSKEKWLQITIIMTLIILCTLNISLCISGDFPITFAILQVASYIVAFLLFSLNETKTIKHNLQISEYLAGNLYAMYSVYNIYATKEIINDEFSRHIELCLLFLIFSFLVLTLSKLQFKKYNSIKSAVCVFLGGIALNVSIIYNQDLANYSQWLPEVLKLHLIMSVCYGVALWCITKMKKLRGNEHNNLTTLDKSTLCNAEKSE